MKGRDIITGQGTKREVDVELVRKQNDNRSTLLSLQKTLTDKKTAYKNLKEPQNSALSKKALLKSGIKYGVLGGVLGGFMSVFLICIGFLLSDKLFSEKELKERFNLKVLGVFNKVHNKKFLCQIDDWLSKLEGQDKLSSDIIYQMIATNIKSFSKDDKSLILIGNIDKDSLETVSNHLKELIPEKKIVCGGNVLLNLETLQALCDYNGAVLVERRGISTGEKIEKELEIVRDAGCNPIGCIIL